MVWVVKGEIVANYALVAAGERLCVAGDLEGFFGGTGEFTVVGAAPAVEAGQRLGGLEVHVLDERGESIGVYFVADATTEVDGLVGGRLLSRPHALAGQVWARWRPGPPSAPGQWVAGGTPEREAWLEVARNYTGRRVTNPVPVPVAGEHVTDRPGMYLAIAEAVVGPGGYLGANLDGLHDCLRTVDTPFDLVWRHSGVATAAVGTPVDDVVAVLTEAGVRVILE